MIRRFSKTLPPGALASLMLAVFLGSTVTASSQPQRAYYKVNSAMSYQLPTLGGLESVANDINSLGNIVGWSADAANVKRAFYLKTNGSIQNVGTTVAGEEASAEGINENNEIVGQFLRSRYRPFYWHSSTGIVKMSIDLFPSENFGQYDLWAFAINDNGYVVGRGRNWNASPACRMNAPVVWTNPYAAPKVLLCQGEYWLMTAATDVSNSGWISHFHEEGTYDRAYRHSTYYGVNFSVPDVASGTNSLHLWGVNESGVVVGDAETDAAPNLGYAQVAYYWNGTSSNPAVITPFPGGNKAVAYDVNEQDFAVGYGEKQILLLGNFYLGERAFLWHQEFGRYELPTPAAWQGGVTHCRAHALTDVDTDAEGDNTLRVVGFCQKSGGVKQAVRWVVSIGTTTVSPLNGAN